MVNELSKEEGFKDRDVSELAIDVFDRLLAQKPEAFKAAREAGIDFDAILEWIEQAIAFVLRLIEMFSIFF